MMNLFQKFDRGKTFSRVNEKMSMFLEREMVFAVPEAGRLRDRLADDLVDYIEVMVETRGQESRRASDYICEATDAISVLEIAGVIREGWDGEYFKMGAEILFDELRRCGIGKCEGVFTVDMENE